MNMRSLLMAFLFSWIYLFLSQTVEAHDMYMGIMRPDGKASCCGDMAYGGDCRPARITTQGDQTLIDGHPWQQDKIRPSPDSRYHICEKAGTIFCILVPPGT